MIRTNKLLENLRNPVVSPRQRSLENWAMLAVSEATNAASAKLQKALATTEQMEHMTVTERESWLEYVRECLPREIEIRLRATL